MADGVSLINDGDGETYQGCRFDTENKIIDFILPYLESKQDADYERKSKIRQRFLDTLNMDYGLEYEVSVEGDARSSYGSIQMEGEHDEKIHYVKLHAPIGELYDAAEDLKMKMPTTVNDIEIKPWYEKDSVMKIRDATDPFIRRRPHVVEPTEYFVRTFVKDRLTEFHNHDKPEIFFSPAERGRLVHSMLREAPYGDEEEDIGIENLIYQGVFTDAFPLHGGKALENNSDSAKNNRQRLEKDWATWKKIFKYQPIEGIREYFGEKIALYFSWLGFYTTMLIPAAVIGIVCFIYGILSTWGNDQVRETCGNPMGDGNTTYKLLMCPECDKYCSYYLLSDTCMYAKATHFFDNDATVFFAIFMSLWSTLFLELWKRQQVTLAQKWHSMGFEEGEEKVRPEYTAANKQLKKNPVTMKMEPFMPKGARWRRIGGSLSIVLVFIVLILICVVAVIIFRASVSAALLGSPYKKAQQYSSMVVSVCAGFLNLVAINILKFLYNRIAVKLTDWENPRTRTDYEDSFTIKMFLFQFANTYASIFYIAFFRGTGVTGFPGHYTRVGKSGVRFAGCGPRGCFLGLTIQLIIIMVGQQFIGNVNESLIPTLKKWWNDRKKRKAAEEAGKSRFVEKQWEDDYEGEAQDKFSLFWEYLEIVLQYGFVTMFVAGFPLAPFFALLNNILEIRVDAINYVCNNRRPVARRAEDIGAWMGIMNMVTSVAVLVNAFVIAFTSTFIERTVYSHMVGGGSTKGYVEWSLSYFNVTGFSDKERPLNATLHGIPEQPYCRFPGFRDNAPPYNRSIRYWHILSARLGFVLAFVMFVLFVDWLIKYLVPDMPRSVLLRKKREKFLQDTADRQHKEKSGRRRPKSPTGSPGPKLETNGL